MPDIRRMHALAGQLRAKRTESARAAGRKKWYDVRNAVGDSTDVYLYDMVGEDMWGDGVSARDFADELKAIASPRISLHINCEGGEVFDGIAIYECLKQHPALVATYVDSLAASAASFIAMAADPYDTTTGSGGVWMARNSRMMIHDAAMGGAYAAGNAADMRDFAKAVEEMADLLDDMSLNIADIYAQRAGGTAADWRARMQAETWYSAQAAIDAGLADGVTGDQTTTAPPGAEEAAEMALDLSALVAAIEGVFRA